MPELDWSVLLEYLFEKTKLLKTMFFITYFPTTTRAESLLLPGELLMQRPGPHHCSLPVLPVRDHSEMGYGGSGFRLELREGHKVAGRCSCWRQIMVLSEHKSPQEFPGGSDLSKILNDSLKHRMGGDTNYWCQPCIRPHPGTSSICCLTQPPKNLVDEGLQIPTLTD